MFRSALVALGLATALVGLQAAQSAPPFPSPPATRRRARSPIPAACRPNACASRAWRSQPMFPPGQYPVLAAGRRRCSARATICRIRISEASTGGSCRPAESGDRPPASRTAPDGTIWVADRCGNSGAGGTTCGGASAAVNPIFQFEPSGKLLRNFGAGMFVSPHKLTVDAAGNLWLADNGSHQVFKMIPDGKVLMTLGKKGVAGPGTDEFDAPTEVAVAPTATSSSPTATPAAGWRPATRAS